MSQADVEIVRRVVEAWNRYEPDAALPSLDPEVVFDATRRRLNPKTYVGLEGMQEMLADRDEIWEKFGTQPLEFIDAGERVVVVGRWVGKGKSSGIEIDQPTAHVFTLHAGRITRWEFGY